MFQVTKEPKNRLDSNIFTPERKLMPDLKEKIVSEVYQLAPELGLEPDDVLGIYIVGSSVSYNWYPEADIDVNVLVDWDKNPVLLESPSKYQGFYLGKFYWKPVTYYFTKDIGNPRSIFDVLADSFVVDPKYLQEYPTEEAIHWVKEWLKKFSFALGELQIDIESYKSIREDYELLLEFGTKEQVENQREKLQRISSEIEKDIQVLILNYKLLVTGRGIFKENFWNSVGNVAYKAIEYSSYKTTVKEIKEIYKKYKTKEIDFNEMIKQIREVL